MKRLSLYLLGPIVLAGCEDIVQPELQTGPQFSVTPTGMTTTGIPIVEIGVFPGGADSYTRGINERGWVVGSGTHEDGFEHAFLWTPERGIVDLGTVGHRSTAVDVNDLGWIVGRTTIDGDPWNHPCYWTKQDGMVVFETLGPTGAQGLGVNNRGQIVGETWWFNQTPSLVHPYVWSNQDGMVDLGTFGGIRGHARRINDRGQAVGSATYEDGRRRAFLWTARRGLVDLGTLGGNYSTASDINNRGQVVGWSYPEEGGGHAFLWTEDDGMVDLGTFGGRSTVATAINDRGQVVGEVLFQNGEGHAFLWTEKDGMTDLGAVAGWLRSRPADINEQGQVVGAVCQGTSNCRAIMWLVSPSALSESGP